MTVPVEYSESLGREIRVDDIDTLGTSTLTLFEDAAREGRTGEALRLLRYFWDEVLRMNEILFVWMEEIVAFRLECDRVCEDGTTVAPGLLRGLREFEPTAGDRAAVQSLLADGDVAAAIARAELARVRFVGLHDAWIAWIQRLMSDLAADHGEDAVKDQVVRTYQKIWGPRYEKWNELSPRERIQLSVEGMRGHLSGKGRRGDITVLDEGDRYVMVLDPCGSCGVLRRGDPDSGRPPADPAGNREPHPWTWFRTGLSWYSAHSPIALEWIPMQAGRPPTRPLENCDSDGPCRWYIYKDPEGPRREHYERMGFEPIR